MTDKTYNGQIYKCTGCSEQKYISSNLAKIEFRRAHHNCTLGKDGSKKLKVIKDGR